MCKEELQKYVSIVCCVDSISKTLFKIRLFVLQRNKCGHGTTSEGKASASAEEKDPLLQDHVD